MFCQRCSTEKRLHNHRVRENYISHLFSRINVVYIAPVNTPSTSLLGILPLTALLAGNFVTATCLCQWKLPISYTSEQCLISTESIHMQFRPLRKHELHDSHSLSQGMNQACVKLTFPQWGDYRLSGQHLSQSVCLGGGSPWGRSEGRSRLGLVEGGARGAVAVCAAGQSHGISRAVRSCL